MGRAAGRSRGEEERNFRKNNIHTEAWFITRRWAGPTMPAGQWPRHAGHGGAGVRVWRHVKSRQVGSVCCESPSWNVRCRTGSRHYGTTLAKE